jgi:hypothetical protein
VHDAPLDAPPDAGLMSRLMRHSIHHPLDLLALSDIVLFCG